MSNRVDFASIPVLNLNDTYDYEARDKVVRFQVEWTSRTYGIICDLDLHLYLFDERARFIEKLDVTSNRSKDGACVLVSDQEGANNTSNVFTEHVKIDFKLVDKECSAIMLFLDGGPRNFQFVQSITVLCEPVAARSVLPGQSATPALFQFTEKSRKDFQGVALAVVYKDGWQPIPLEVPSDAAASDDTAAPPGDAAAANTSGDKMVVEALKDGGDKKSGVEEIKEGEGGGNNKGADLPPGVLIDRNPMSQFVCRAIFEPVFVSSKKAKDEKVMLFVVSTVPALEKFRPRLFTSVNDVCAALSSESLPGLKEKFTAIHSGLPIGPFTEVIFRQLYKTHPKIADFTERAYTVAMIQEMFQQIDFNGDGSADWDEFTTFCIQTASDGKSGVGGSTIDEYVIEYQEDSMKRDRVLSPYRPVSLMRFVPETRRFLVIPDEADKVLMMDERFRVRGYISPHNITVKNAMGITVGPDDDDDDKKKVGPNNVESRRIIVYDICFLTGKDLYAFSCSDHTITVCREQGGIGNRPGAHVLYTRLYHEMLHLKLCWSEQNNLLCSVANDRVIYGWDIDKPLPIFQVSRHSDIVTDFVACDNLDTFVTCSMDKRIVMWSAHTRRVKGIFLGHKRGVRCLSCYDTTLLSAGFESDARTWDLQTKENIAILKGHRFPIADAKLMCELAQNEKEYRAVTVDESGELRLWNIFVKEKASDAVFVPTLQVFQMHNPSTPMSNIKFLAVPNNAQVSTSYYSNLVAVGTKMLNFLPEKNTKEFVPPSSCVFNEAAAELCTLVGKSLFKYDVCKGTFTSMHHDVHPADVTAIVLDGPRGRRCFVGCGNGDLLLVNYMQGTIIDSVSAHKKEVSCIVSIQGARNSVYSGAADGSIVITEEHKGDLHVHSSVETAFGDGVGIIDIKVAQSIGILVATSTGTHWGLWHSATCKRVALFNEVNHGGQVSRVEILGASRDIDDLSYLDANFNKMRKSTLQKREKEKLLTVAVCTVLGVHVYTMDVSDMRGVCSQTFTYEKPLYITELTMLQYPQGDSVNYARMKGPRNVAALAAAAAAETGADAAAATEEGKKVAGQDSSSGNSSSSATTSGKKSSNEGGNVKEFAHGGLRMGTGLDKGSQALIVTTDEGLVVVWDTTGIRMQSEDKYRARYPIAKKAKRSSKDTAGSEKRPMTSDTRPTTCDTVDLEGDFPTDAFVEGNDNLDDFKEPSINSLSSSGVANGGVVSEFETQHFFVVDAFVKGLHDHFENGRLPEHLLTPDAPRHHERMRPALSFPAHLDSICVLVPMHEHGCIVTASHDGYHRVWNLDATCLGELPLPNLTDKMKVPKEPIVGTLGTTTETDMKHWSRPTGAVTGAPPATGAVATGVPMFLNPWKFIQERIAITAVHHDLAERLVAMCTKKNDGIPNKSGKGSFRMSIMGNKSAVATKDQAMFNSLLMTHERGRTPSAVELALNREEAARIALRECSLTCMNEEIGPREDGPPMTIPTKDEIKLLELTDKLSNTTIRREKREIYGYDEETGRLGSPGSPVAEQDQGGFTSGNASPFFLTQDDSTNSIANTSSFDLNEEGKAAVALQDLNAIGATHSPISKPGTATTSRVGTAQRKRAVRNFGGKNALWHIAGDSSTKNADKTRVHPAFSEASLVGSMTDGVLDEESFSILRQFSASKSNVHQYMNTTKGTILLRNPTLSTSIELPAIEGMRRAEIAFGPQKDYYSNAEKVLNDRDNLNKDKMRNAITLGRIEHNVKKVGSMMHLLNPIQVDDVKIPVDNKALEYKFKMEAEDKRMQVRLVESAQLVNEPLLDDDDGQSNGRSHRDILDAADTLHSTGVPNRKINKFRAGQVLRHAQMEAKAADTSVPDPFAREDEKKKELPIDEIHARNVSFLNQLGSKRRPLDKSAMYRTLDHVKNATAAIHHDVFDAQYAYTNSSTRKVKQNLPQAAKDALEKKVRNALKDDYAENQRLTALRDRRQLSRGKSASSLAASPEKDDLIDFDDRSRPGTVDSRSHENKIVLETRALLPYYKAEDVRHFMDIFIKVDEDFSGDLDMDEWVKLFSSINKAIPEQESRSIFMKFKNEKGVLTVNELVPVVFSNATKDQLKIITKFCLAEIMRPDNEKTELTFADVDQLFEIYDHDNVGFVGMGFIRDKIRDMPISEGAIQYFLNTIKDIDEDEMVNHREFSRMWRHVVNKQEIVAQRIEEDALDKAAGRSKRN